ncbi:MAG: hypothetical protein IT305_02780 [Chloroflexi bacterium]|nr:hypothetical protein [Chloroflexota bacterium]
MTAGTSKMQPKQPVPEFRTREEEAEFWDTHDFADYWDEWAPAQVSESKNLSEGITIRLDPDTMKRVRQEAKQRGIGPTTLIRMWVLERLGAETGTVGSRPPQSRKSNPSSRSLGKRLHADSDREAHTQR